MNMHPLYPYNYHALVKKVNSHFLIRQKIKTSAFSFLFPVSSLLQVFENSSTINKHIPCAFQQWEVGKLWEQSKTEQHLN